MKIKGHTVIELTDVKTGKVERYEDDNMVTNGVAKYLEDLGMMNNSPLMVSAELRTNPLVRLMGGLLLFDAPLDDTDADNITIPCGVHMVGNGAYNKTYGSIATKDVKELGSWNDTQSVWLSDGSFQMVWDFPTTQANGTIACACLTSDRHGWVGEGNPGGVPVRYDTGTDQRSTDYHNLGTPYLFFEDQWKRYAKFVVHGSRTESTLTFISKQNIEYNAEKADEHMGTTGKIKLLKYKIPATRFDMRMMFPFSENGGGAYMPHEETEITIPAAFAAAIYGKTPLHYIRHGQYYYIITDGNTSGWRDVFDLPSGVQTLHVLRINPDDTVDYKTAVVPSNYTRLDLKQVCFSTSHRIAMPIIGWSEEYGSYFWVQDMSNKADEKMVPITGYNRPDLRPGFGLNRPDDGIGTFSWNGYSWRVNIDETNPDLIVIPQNMNEGGKVVSMLDDNPLVFDIEDTSGSLTRMQKSQGYIATINNLAEPVVKTAQKSMKVTYTIRFNDGE